MKSSLNAFLILNLEQIPILVMLELDEGETLV